MKLLMITSRNIDRNGGENALIIGRHSALYTNYGLETDVLFFHKDTKSSYTEENNGITFIGCELRNLKGKIDSLLASGEYQGIITSGFYDVEFTRYIEDQKRKNGLIYIIDIHATIREVYEFCIPDLYHILGTRYLYLKNKAHFIRALKCADYAFVVSDEEITEVNSFYPDNRIHFIKIRCGCTQKFDLDVYTANREKQRRQFGFDPDDLAFVYSGSKDRWQKFEDTIKLFEIIQKTGVACKFAFYMNLDEATKNMLYSKFGRKNVCIRWVEPSTMKQELVAYDIGVMLRDNKWTNRVAFPNKFSDYISSGLFVVLSDAVVEPYNLAKQCGLQPLNPEDLKSDVSLIQMRRRNELASYLEKCEKFVANELLYSTQVSLYCTDLLKQLSVIQGAQEKDA